MKIQLLPCLCFLIAGWAENVHAQQSDFYSFQGSQIFEMDEFGSFPLRVNDENYLYVEAPSGLYQFIEKEDSTGAPYYSYQAFVNYFALNPGQALDLTHLAQPKQLDDYRIVSLYDVDGDQKNDIICSYDHYLFWLKSEGEGRYAAPIQVGGQFTPHNDLLVLAPGILLVDSYTPKVSEFSLYDFRNGSSKIRELHMNLKNPANVGAIYRENERFYLVIRDASNLVAFREFGASKSSWKVTLTDLGDYFTLADFNKDGHLDMVNSNELDLHLYRGEGEGLLAKAGNLLEPMDSLFLQEITSSLESNQYYTWDTYKDMCLDWLSTGNLSNVDLNNDGFTDILYHQEFFIAYLNNKDGSFTRFVLGGPYDPHEYTLADFNGDENLEILINAYSGQFVIENTGNAFREIQLSPKSYEDAFLVTDLDHDGDADVLFCSEEKALEWSENKEGILSKAVVCPGIK